jgi:ribosomal protein L11 methyltransferase
MFLWRYHATSRWLSAHEQQLVNFGNVAIIDRPGRALSIVEIVCETKAAANELVRSFGGSFEKIPRNWEKKYLRPQRNSPLRIGRRLMVMTEKQILPSDRAQLVIPAAGAFGTGEHATTAMSLRLLEEVSRSFSLGWRMLDVGTGTGILALAGRRFGAHEVLGLDLDPSAVAHAKENARRNHIREIEFVRADILRWKSARRFDLITANLFSELLIAALPKFHRALRGEACLILSGILREQADAVIRALHLRGFEVVRQRRRGKWIAIFAARKT